MTTILEPEVCPTCGHGGPVPHDGQWRWAKSGRVFSTLEHAQEVAAGLNGKHRSGAFEFRAELDAQGRPRIASRRKAAS